MTTPRFAPRCAATLLLLICFASTTFAQQPATKPLYIDSTGRVGIGINTPAEKLHVVGNARVDGTTTLQGHTAINGNIAVTGILDMGAGKDGKEANAGRICYGCHEAGKLTIVGAGNSVDTRKVKLFSEGGMEVQGNLGVSGRVTDNTGYVVPVGGIIMFTGNSADLFDANGRGKAGSAVQGWALCDGKDGRPNLIDRFVVGGGPGSKYGTTTGSGSAVGGSDTKTLSVAEMPSHSHSFKLISWNGTSMGRIGGNAMGPSPVDYRTANEGGNQAYDTRPQYYAVFYIMKL